MRRTIWLAAVILSTVMSGCASLPYACLPPSRVMASAEIIFGRNIGDRVGVSDNDFTRFLAEELTPRFPDGLTVIDARGQWRDGTRNALIREPSKVVLLAFADGADKRAAVSAVAEAYKLRFRQHSVLTSVRTACVSF